MKKNVCFAGFAESELPALRAAIVTSNLQWECRFVEDAAAALALLARQPQDALVANMALPGKTGAELLHEARELSPKTLGFIVGEVSDQMHILGCIGGPHQFIRRPFQATKLVANLKRGLTLDTWLATDDLHKLVPQLRRLPSLPSTYFNLLKELESDRVTTQGIGAVIARDPVVTARLLQMVNSAAFSLALKVTDPVDAVAVLGVETVKSLVMGLQVFSQSDEAREAGFSLEILWEHSLLVAKFARQITLKQTGDARLASDAFTAGLLHDVGRIVIASNLAKEYAAVIASARENGRPLHEEEIAKLRVSHAGIGAYLLGLWGLPVEIVEATAGHHAPGQTVFASEFSLLGAVHAANVFAHETGGQTDGLCLPKLDWDYFKTIQLDEQLPVWREICTGEKPPPPPMKIETVVRAPAAPKKTKKPAAASASYLGYGLLAVFLLLLMIGGMVAWHTYDKTTILPKESEAAPAKTNAVAIKPPTAVPIVQPAPVVRETNVQVVPVSPAPPVSPFDRVRLQGIFYRSTNPQAIINGKTLGIGDRINGLEVIGIDQHSVTLQLNGERRVLKMN